MVWPSHTVLSELAHKEINLLVADLLALRNHPRDLLPMKPNQTHVTWSSKLPLFYLSSAVPPPPVHLISWVDPVCREEHVAQGGWVREAKKSCGCETKGLHHSLSPGILPSTTKGRTRPYHSVDLRRIPQKRCYSPTHHVSSLCSFADLTRRQVCLISAALSGSLSHRDAASTKVQRKADPQMDPNLVPAGEYTNRFSRV